MSSLPPPSPGPVPLRRRAPLWVAVVAVIAALLAVLAWVSRPQPAPSVALTTLTGEPRNPAQLRGKVQLVNFWATSCAVCVAEMPEFVRLHERLAARGLEVTAIAMRYDRPDFVVAYQERVRLPFAVALDLDGSAARGFGEVRATPTTFVIDAQGQVVARYQGQPDFAELERRLVKLLDA
ncbi:MAG TPA: TlpA disulfide reductase family protein [Burkholderiaceae bacterium]|nr:TlpA disulfide reductase family protein [Burkholderiaceae bacterium]